MPSTTTAGYPVVERNDAEIRAFKDDVLAILGKQPLIDVRSPQEYTGERTHMPDYPEEGALRGGHIPTAQVDSVGEGRRGQRTLPQPGRTRRAVRDSSRPTTRRSCTAASANDRATPGSCCTHLLGLPGVRNYDGSWTEWGNAVRVPVAVGEEPGEAP